MTGTADTGNPLIDRPLSQVCEALARSSMRYEDSGEADRIVNGNLVMLQHAVPHFVGRVTEDRHLMWDIGPLLFEAGQLLNARDAILSCLQALKWDASTVVSLSTPAAPLAALLATDPRLTPGRAGRLCYLDNYTGQLSHHRFDSHERVLLFDTLVRSGWHASVGYELIRSMGASIVGVFTLCLGIRDESDLQSMSKLSLDLLVKHELSYAYSWRQLLSLASGPPTR